MKENTTVNIDVALAFRIMEDNETGGSGFRAYVCA